MSMDNTGHDDVVKTFPECSVQYMETLIPYQECKYTKSHSLLKTVLMASILSILSQACADKLSREMKDFGFPPIFPHERAEEGEEGEEEEAFPTDPTKRAKKVGVTYHCQYVVITVWLLM